MYCSDAYNMPMYVYKYYCRHFFKNVANYDYV